MRLSCLQENLAKGLSVVGRAVSTRSTLPIMSHILMEAKNGQLRLAATNLEIGVNCWIAAKVEDEGAITVPARLLTDFVNSLPPDRIDIELVVRTLTVQLSCASYNASIKGLGSEEFPILPSAESADEDESTVQIGEGIHLQLELAGLRKMIEQVSFAAASDETRPTLTGVEVTLNSERMRMVATDGYRLSLRSMYLKDSAPSDEINVIVPARSLGEFARISADADPDRPVDVVITSERNQVLFQIAGRGADARGGFLRAELASLLVDGRFPNYTSIIPTEHKTRTVVDTAALLKAVRVASLFVRDSHIVKLEVSPGNGAQHGSVRLTAATEDNNSVNEIEANVEGDGLEIAFDPRYLLDVLSHIDEPQVVLETTIETRPGALRPLGIGEDEFLHVVMPMHLNSRRS